MVARRKYWSPHTQITRPGFAYPIFGVGIVGPKYGADQFKQVFAGRRVLCGSKNDRPGPANGMLPEQFHFHARTFLRTTMERDGLFRFGPRQRIDSGEWRPVLSVPTVFVVVIDQQCTLRIHSEPHVPFEVIVQYLQFRGQCLGWYRPSERIEGKAE